jgi:CO/xanthine dehydrogenase Mo-binding subunit
LNICSKKARGRNHDAQPGHRHPHIRHSRQTLVISGACKVPYYNRRILARMLGLPEQSIEMVEGDVGGGFGVRGEFYPEDFLIPFAARKLNRAVKWIEDRRENLIASNHARDAECELEIACERDGTIRDRNSGMAMTGPFKREMILGLCTLGAGPYPIARDDRVRVRSNQDFGRFLASIFSERPRTP